MAITRKAIVAAMEKGIITANDKYEHWSNGSWVTDSGVESLMVTCIAETVNKCQGPHESLGLEVSFGAIKDLSTARPRRGRQPRTVKTRNRADIVLFNGTFRGPRSLISTTKRCAP